MLEAKSALLDTAVYFAEYCKASQTFFVNAIHFMFRVESFRYAKLEKSGQRASSKLQEREADEMRSHATRIRPLDYKFSNRGQK
jgi:hypothetical protein